MKRAPRGLPVRLALLLLAFLMAGCAAPGAAPHQTTEGRGSWSTLVLDCAGTNQTIPAMEMTDTGSCRGTIGQFTQHTYFLDGVFALHNATVHGRFAPYDPFLYGPGTYRWSVDASLDGKQWAQIVSLAIDFDGSGRHLTQDWQGSLNVSAARVHSRGVGPEQPGPSR